MRGRSARGSAGHARRRSPAPGRWRMPAGRWCRQFAEQRFGHRAVVQRPSRSCNVPSRRMNFLVGLPGYSGANISAAYRTVWRVSGSREAPRAQGLDVVIQLRQPLQPAGQHCPGEFVQRGASSFCPASPSVACHHRRRRGTRARSPVDGIPHLEDSRATRRGRRGAAVPLPPADGAASVRREMPRQPWHGLGDEHVPIARGSQPCWPAPSGRHRPHPPMGSARAGGTP